MSAHTHPRPESARTLVVPTGNRVSADAIASAIHSAVRDDGFIWVAIPCVIPPALPIGAVPPRLHERLRRQQQAALTAIRQTRGAGKVEIVPCRSVSAMIGAACALEPVAGIVLAGPAGWWLRREIHGLAPVTTGAGRTPRPTPPTPTVPALDARGSSS